MLGGKSESAQIEAGLSSSDVQPDRPVIECGWGVVVYPPEVAGGVWRAAFTEGGVRRFRQASSEAGLAVKLEKARERLAAGATRMERPGAGVAWYLDPDRHPADRQWSRKHAHAQARLCDRFAAPVIAAVTCQDITPAHMQQVASAPPPRARAPAPPA